MLYCWKFTFVYCEVLAVVLKLSLLVASNRNNAIKV